MADEANLNGVQETTDPSWDSTEDVTDERIDEYEEGTTNENGEDNSGQ